jgi:ABC-type methionine transport system ATPase subunit
MDLLTRLNVERGLTVLMVTHDTRVLDIADRTGAAFVAVTHPGGTRSTFHLVDLATGKATLLGTIGGGETVRGISSEP